MKVFGAARLVKNRAVNSSKSCLQLLIQFGSSLWNHAKATPQTRGEHLAHDGIISVVHEHGLMVVLDMSHRVRVRLIRQECTVFHPAGKLRALQLAEEGRGCKFAEGSASRGPSDRVSFLVLLSLALLLLFPVQV